MGNALFGYSDFGYTSPKPNMADFLSTMYTEVGLTSSDIDENSQYAKMALAFAVHWVYRGIQRADNCIYLRAVYCLATDRVVNYAYDSPDSVTRPFAKLRELYGLSKFSPGVISSSSDNGTSQSYQVSETLNKLTLADLQNLKTPWGREYMGYAQQASPIWGMS